MFQVGKKYQGKISGAIITCLFVTENKALMEYNGGHEFLIPHTDISAYREYKEPEKKTIWVFLLSSENNGLGKEITTSYHENSTYFDKSLVWKVLAKKEVTITEGEGM